VCHHRRRLGPGIRAPKFFYGAPNFLFLGGGRIAFGTKSWVSLQFLAHLLLRVKPSTDVFISHLTHFMHLLYLGKLSRPKYCVKIKMMKMSQEDAILIKNVCQSGMLHKGCWVNSSTTAGNLEALTVCWRESTRWVVQFSGNRAASDSILMRSSGGPRAQSGGQAKMHRLAREILYKTDILHSSMLRIIHCDFQIKTSCSAVVWSQSHLLSHSLMNSLIDDYRLQ